jgi:alkylated DNA repair dioxygenase AlkB
MYSRCTTIEMDSSGNLFGDLFEEPRNLEAIKLADADLKFAPRFFGADEADHWFKVLMQETPWRQDPIKVWGKMYLQPRLTAWYGDPGNAYTYSGITMQPLPWTAALAQIKATLEDAAKTTFNSVLINLYRNQQDSVGWHSDDEPELGKNPVIASLSLGETRTFKLKHKSDKLQKPLAIDLSHGSLLIMGGTTQQCWAHAVEKERSVKGPRINLTFRQIRF